MALTVGVLGPIEAHRDGVLLAVPAGKTRELLARLAVDAGRFVRVDVLLDDVWAGAPTGRNTLQSKVSQLRRAVGPDAVIGTADGYRLAVAPDSVDAWQATSSAQECAAARDAGDATAALRAARAGLRLYRGEVLADVGDWADVHRTRLTELQGDLLEQSVAARVDLGAGAELVSEVESLLAAHPLREGLWTCLIIALYRAGRQSDALAAYQRARRLLDDELGVAPGPRLQAVHREVLQHDPALIGDPPIAPAPGNLPPLDPTPMVGRDPDVEEVTALLGSRRLVTVLGAGGIGKTRLALEVAHRLQPPTGGVWLIRLDGLRAGAELATVVAETLQVVGGERALLDRLGGAPTVLVLDNCEHLVAPVAVLVRSMLDAAPGLRVLATSQAPLGLREEARHRLAPLDPPDAVELFTQRARQVRRTLVLDETVSAAIEDACRSLEGLPLAIELAAARTRALSVRDVARRLDDRFVLLDDPSSSDRGRHRALVAAIGWSYDLLFPDDQRVLCALAGFTGGGGLDAVEAVVAVLDVPTSLVADAVTRLADRSLITVEVGEGDQVRYRVVDSIRLYALDRAESAGTRGRIAAAHAAWFGEVASWCQARIRSQHQASCLRIARADRANLDAALAWCRDHDPVLGARIAAGFGWTWVVLGDGTAGAARLRGALSPECPVRDRIQLGLVAAWLEASAGNVGVAQADLDAVRPLVVRLDDPVLAADLARHQAFVAIQHGRSDLVRASAAQALRVYEEHSLVWSAAACRLLAAYGAIMAGETARAQADADAALTELRVIGDAWGIVHGEAMLGAIAQAEGRFDDAADALRRAVTASEALGFVGQSALHRAGLARALHRAGDASAGEAYQAALQAAAEIGDGRLAATVRVQLARWRRHHGDRAAARRLLEDNERWYLTTGGGGFALLNRSLLASARDDTADLTVILAAADAAGDHEAAVQALDGLARLAARSGDLVGARRLLADADARAREVAYDLDPRDRDDARAARTIIDEFPSPDRGGPSEVRR